MKNKIGNVLLYVAVIALVAYLFVNNYNLRQKVQNIEHLAALNEAYVDSLRTEYDAKTGEYTSTISAYVAENKTLTQFLKEKDEELYRLKKKGAVTGGKVSTETKVDTVVVTEYLPNDSTTRIAKVDAMPHYTAEVTSLPDSTRIKLAAYVHLGWDITDGKLNLTHDNPYLTINNARGFYVLPKDNKRNYKWWLGVAAGLTGGYLIFK